MSKITLPVLAALLILAALPSCRKVYDFIRDHPDAHENFCRVSKLTIRGALGDPDLFIFSYNAKGNPISIVDSVPPGSNGNVDQYFRYDGLDRLTDFITTFIGSNVAIIWHKYAYPGQGFITDTVLEYTGRSDGPAPIAGASSSFLLFIHGYSLDARGRISKYWTLSENPHQPPVFDGDAIYDAGGNLPLPHAGLYYDDKVNVYRTNKIWQFVYQDYSRNNILPSDPGTPYPPLPLPVYNDFGLPVLLPNSLERNRTLFFLNNTNPTMVITYACSMPKGSVDY